MTTEILGETRFKLDLGDPLSVVEVGDWLANDPGSRYVVMASRKVNTRDGRNCYALDLGRLPRHEPVPTDGTRVWWYTAYPRKPRRR